MGRIFYLCGKSSSGKDTIFKSLLEKDGLSLETIVPYTTRPIRAGETEGVEYHFVREAALEEAERTGKLIECRSYDTFHGIWKYFTVDDEQIDFEKENYLMIGTLESFLQIRKYYGEERIVPIYIDIEDGVRLQRALDREKTQDNPKYQELCRRFLADAADFDEDKMKEAGISRHFYNDDLERCMEEVSSYIQERITSG